MSTETLSIIIAVLTALVFAAIGILYIRGRRLSVEEFIVNRNTAGAGVAVATVVASIAGAWILFSPAETGTWAGLIALIGYGIGQAAPIVAFAVIGPRMRRLMPKGHSVTEYAWHRFGKAMYVFVLAVMLFYMFVFLSAELTGTALALNLIADVPLIWTALIVAIGTLAYTAYGGIRASIFTDTVQFLVILPLFLIAFVATVVAIGGFGDAFEPVRDSSPELLSLSHVPGIEFGLTLVIAVFAANMFHQGFWQRVYNAKDNNTLRKAFAIGGVLVIPIIILAGLFGIMAVGYGFGDVDKPASVALFWLILEILPTWAVMVILVLALGLVMSSMDTLLNGIVSAVTSDLPRVRPSIKTSLLLRWSRALTVVVAIPAVFIAAQGYSVLYLFLIADLVCAGAVFPVFYGLYSRRLSGTAALASCVAGIAVGTLFFPTPEAPYLVGWIIDIEWASQLLVSFGAAFAVSTVIAVVWSAVASRSRTAQDYDFEGLQERVEAIQG